MMMRNWKKFFWKNLVSNYVRQAMRMITGLILFRLLFQYLTKEEFSFYNLLWSLFGSAIFLDFGLGLTAQKMVAQYTTQQKKEPLNQMIGTIFWSFAAIGALLLFGALLAENWFLEYIHVSPENFASFSQAYRYFMIGVALALPLGMFQEVLRGMQRIDLVNYLFIAASIANVVITPYALLQGWSFQWIVLISITLSIIPIASALILSKKLLPSLSLRPGYFTLSALKPTIGFSVAAYLNTSANILITRVDAIVISFGMGVSYVALYLVGLKIADIYYIFMVQLQEILSPASAEMRALNDHHGVCRLLLRSNRLALFLSTIFYALAATHLETSMQLITGLEEITKPTYYVGQTLLLAIYSTLITSSCGKRIMMMWGREKTLLSLTLIEAASNLLLSILLMYWLGIVGVAIGTAIPAILVGWFLLIPLTADFLRMSTSNFLRELFIPVLYPLCWPLLALFLLFFLFPAGPEYRLTALLIHGVVVLGIAFLSGKKMLTTINA